MKRKAEKPCQACGKHKKLCAFCKAKQGFPERRGVRGIPTASWFILVLGGVIALMLLNN